MSRNNVESIHSDKNEIIVLQQRTTKPTYKLNKSHQTQVIITKQLLSLNKISVTTKQVIPFTFKRV